MATSAISHKILLYSKIRFIDGFKRIKTMDRNELKVGQWIRYCGNESDIALQYLELMHGDVKCIAHISERESLERPIALRIVGVYGAWSITESIIHDLVDVSDETIECYECSKTVQYSDAVYHDGVYYCHECIETCERCSTAVPTSSLFSVESGDTRVCDRCFENCYQLCESCNEYHLISEGWFSDDEFYCESCADDLTVRCESCGNRVLRGDAYYRRNDSDHASPYCSYNCMGNAGSTYFHESHCHIPNLIFHKDIVDTDTNVRGYFGLEIEMDDGDGRDVCDEFANSIGEKLLYCKYDGSLGENGVECVTHPMTLDFALNCFPWNKFHDIARDHGYKSHDTDTCGLHIHVSRTYFGDTKKQQNRTIGKAIRLIEKFWDEYIVKFSRRTGGDGFRYCKKNHADILSADDTEERCNELDTKLCHVRHDRYQAVNLQNSDTVEFRFFKGTLKVDTIKAMVQFLHNLIDIASRTKADDIDSLSWPSVIHANDFSELNTYNAKTFINQIQGDN